MKRKLSLLVLAMCLMPFLLGAKVQTSDDEPHFQLAYFQKCYEKAQTGDAAAQLKLAYYYAGREEFAKAMEWAKKSSKQNNPKACILIGHFYENGAGIEKDEMMAKAMYSRAFKLATQKAQEGDPIAQLSLSEIYLNGYSVQKDLNEAIKWLSLSAKNNYEEAQYVLASFYLIGYGVEKDETKYRELLREAAENGCAEAQYYMGRLTSDKEEAAQWYKGAAEQGHCLSQYDLGMLYSEGKGVTQNKTEAVRWFLLSAEQNLSLAQYELYLAFRDGEGVAKNQTIAYQWLQKSAENGYETAKEELAIQERQAMQANIENNAKNDLAALKRKIGTTAYNSLNSGNITNGMKWSSIMAYRDYINKYNYVSGAQIIDHLPSEVKVSGIRVKETSSSPYGTNYAIDFSNRKGGTISGGFIRVQNGVVTSVNLERAR